jgi:hypothetical protein
MQRKAKLKIIVQIRGLNGFPPLSYVLDEKEFSEYNKL